MTFEKKSQNLIKNIFSSRFYSSYFNIKHTQHSLLFHDLVHNRINRLIKYLGPNLIAALTSLEMGDLTHFSSFLFLRPFCLISIHFPLIFILLESPLSYKIVEKLARCYEFFLSVCKNVKKHEISETGQRVVVCFTVALDLLFPIVCLAKFNSLSISLSFFFRYNRDRNVLSRAGEK